MPRLAIPLRNQLPHHTPVVSGLLSTSRGTVDLDEPDLQLLVYHEVEAEQLEAVVREVPRADGGLHAREAAPAAEGRRDTGGGSVTGHHVLTQITSRSFKTMLLIRGLVRTLQPCMLT